MSEITATSSPRSVYDIRADPTRISCTWNGLTVYVEPSNTVSLRDRETTVHIPTDALEHYAAEARKMEMAQKTWTIANMKELLREAVQLCETAGPTADVDWPDWLRRARYYVP